MLEEPDAEEEGDEEEGDDGEEIIMQHSDGDVGSGDACVTGDTDELVLS